MKKYKYWIVLNDSGYLFGNYDRTNGGFKRACKRCAFLNYYDYHRIYCLVEISETK